MSDRGAFTFRAKSRLKSSEALSTTTTSQCAAWSSSDRTHRSSSLPEFQLTITIEITWAHSFVRRHGGASLRKGCNLKCESPHVPLSLGADEPALLKCGDLSPLWSPRQEESGDKSPHSISDCIPRQNLTRTSAPLRKSEIPLRSASPLLLSSPAFHALRPRFSGPWSGVRELLLRSSVPRRSSSASRRRDPPVEH